MILTYKNKILVAVDKLIDSGTKHDNWLVDEIEITTTELYQWIREIETMKDREKLVSLKKMFATKGGSIFEFFALDHNFVDKWHKREYSVFYRDIKLRLVEMERTTL